MRAENKGKSSWKWRSLLVVHLSILFGVLLFWFVRAPFNYIDRQAFTILNGWMDGKPFLQWFWALLNHRLVDWIGDGVMLLLFLVYICRKSYKKRLVRFAEMLLFVVCLSAVILFVNTYLFRHPLRFERKSPTLVVENSVRVHDTVRAIKVKDSSKHSFPGDHATTALLFALFFTYFARLPLGFFGIGYGVLMSLPRLIVGAHWLSDVLVGSFSIALLFFSWVIFTPFYPIFLSIFSSRPSSLLVKKELVE